MAAVLHYAAAGLHGAVDMPNLPTAMIGGAIAGALATILAIVAVGVFGAPEGSAQVGVLFAGLTGEYAAGRTDDVWPACLRGLVSAVVLFPAGALLMAGLYAQTH
jgi:hypothetical protein